MPGHLDISLLRTTADLEALAPEWRELWQQDPNAKPFQRPEWLLPWWHHFGRPGLRAVCLRDDKGRLTGLLPLYIYADPARAERQLLLIGAGTTDYLDGLFSFTCTAAHIAEALAAVADEPGWDTAHLTQLPPHSLLKSALDQIDAAAVHSYAGESCSLCPAVPIADLPKKVRSDVRYFRNAATGLGKLHLKTADASSCRADLEILIDLHSASWRERGEPGVLADPDVLAWHREAVPLLQAVDCLRLYVLYLDTDPIAAMFALIDPPERPRRTLYTYLLGYSPSHAAFKPGTLLTAMVMEAAHAEGVEVIDMLRGNETYKKFWHVQAVPTFGYSFPRTALATR